jgi:hypothetical protein
VGLVTDPLHEQYGNSGHHSGHGQEYEPTSASPWWWGIAAASAAVASVVESAATLVVSSFTLSGDVEIIVLRASLPGDFRHVIPFLY